MASDRQCQGRNLAIPTVQKILEGVCKNGGIDRKVAVHYLRHSFATNLLEIGIVLRYIRELFGHRSSKITKLETHVQNSCTRKKSS